MVSSIADSVTAVQHRIRGATAIVHQSGEPMEQWDYDVVDAGFAGCVLANRLSENPQYRVLLLEADGSDRRIWVRIPIGYARSFRDPAVNWMYQTEPEPALNRRRSYWPRGKVLGGSSSINAMAYVRGQPEDYDHWEQLGNPGWGWCESTGSAFLRPALARANLGLHTQSHASRILMRGGRAVGVECWRDGQRLQALAHREVIVCAGAVNSPQLLELSGIGDAPLLAQHGIGAAVHVPMVGTKLQDHLHITHSYRSSVPSLNDQLFPWTGKLRAALQYLMARSGPLSMSVNQAGGFVRSDAQQARANLQLYFNPASYTTRTVGARRTMNADPFPGFSMSVHACRPTSRGSIHIQSADPFQPPAIRANYLATELDVAEAIAGARLLRALAASAPLCDVIEAETVPGPAHASDAALLEDFRARADTIFHPVGTCAMDLDPATSVVDARLRVHGVRGLRVVDASVFPAITSGNTNAPVIMVAEKGAKMVLEDQAQAARQGPVPS